MTQGPEFPDPAQPPEGQQPPSPSGDQAPPPYGEPTPPPAYGQPAPPPYGEQAAPPPPADGQQPPPYAQQQPPPYGQPSGYPAAPGVPYGASPAAPYGVHPMTGIPYSDKSKLVAGLLQIFIGGFGIGRFYIGDTKTGVWQIVVTVLTCGIGALWGFIDGIIMLATDNVTDSSGRPLRPGA